MKAAIYLCAAYGRRADLARVSSRLAALGFRVTSRWLSCEYAETPEGQARAALDDLADLMRADVVIAFTELPEAGYLSGGRHVELGAALVAGKRILLVGPAENVFHWHPAVERCASLDDAIRRLGVSQG